MESLVLAILIPGGGPPNDSDARITRAPELTVLQFRGRGAKCWDPSFYVARFFRCLAGTRACFKQLHIIRAISTTDLEQPPHVMGKGMNEISKAKSLQRYTISCTIM